MADGTVELNLTSGGAKVDVTEFTRSGSTVSRQRIQIAGTADGSEVDSLNTEPSGSAYGIPVRPVGMLAALQLLAADTTLSSGVAALLSALASLLTELQQKTEPADTQTVGGTVAVSNPFALDATLTGGTQQSKLTDGTNIAKVLGASTAPVAADKALAVTLSPNSAHSTDLSGTATISANSTSSTSPAANSTATFLAVSGIANLCINITGTWVGTLAFELTRDGGTSWASAIVYVPSGTTAGVSSTTANGSWIAIPAGTQGIRVRSTAWTSGSAVVLFTGASVEGFVRAIQGPPSGVAGAWPVQVSDGSNTMPTGDTAARALSVKMQATATVVTSVSDSASAVQLLASNANRRGATFYNRSSALMYLRCSNSTSTPTCSATDCTVPIKPGGVYELPQPVETGYIHGIWTSASGAAVLITEYT